MIKKVDTFLRKNFDISIDTYLRLTNSKLKKLLQCEIKNFLERERNSYNFKTVVKECVQNE